MWAYSEPGEGTTIKVYLPAVESTRQQGARASMPTAAEPVQRAQVLVVEDEPMVLALARRTLESAGHTVLAASNGQVSQALAAISASSCPASQPA